MKAVLNKLEESPYLIYSESFIILLWCFICLFVYLVGVSPKINKHEKILKMIKTMKKMLYDLMWVCKLYVGCCQTTAENSIFKSFYDDDFFADDSPWNP